MENALKFIFDIIFTVVKEIFSFYVMIRVCIALFVVYIVLCIFLYLRQDTMIFFPTKPYNGEMTKDIERIEYNIDGIHLSGFIKKGSGATYFFFGGNASEAYQGIRALDMSGTIISFNYRGYGESSGSPSESGLFSDAVSLYDRLEKDGYLKQNETYLYGKSLGTGVASYLSSKRPSKALILVTPYDSVRNVAQGTYPIFPVGLLLRHHFDTLKNLSDYKNPILIIYGGKDIVIPNRNTKNLIDHVHGESQVVFIPDAGHDDIISFTETKEAILSFVKSN